MGREANVFDCALDYDELTQSIKAKDKTKFLYTVEFFPEEGKYHFDGHRKCGVCWKPSETQKHHSRCTSCGRAVTVGVMHRIEHLADRPEGFVPPHHIPFKNMVPLDEIIGEALGVGPTSQAVEREYRGLIQQVADEFTILLETPEEELKRHASGRIVEGILRVRKGQIKIQPGYDGEYGKVEIFTGEEAKKEKQLELF